MTATARAVITTLRQYGPLTIMQLRHYTGADWRRLYGATVELENAGLLRCLAARRPWRYAAVKTDS